jgi:hypothetical protein
MFVDPRTGPKPPFVGSRPEPARDPKELVPLSALCRNGRIYEVEGWIQAGKPIHAVLSFSEPDEIELSILIRHLLCRHAISLSRVDRRLTALPISADDFAVDPASRDSDHDVLRCVRRFLCNTQWYCIDACR